MKTRVSLRYFVSYCRPPLLRMHKSFIRPHRDMMTSYMTEHVIPHFIKIFEKISSIVCEVIATVFFL